MPRRPHARAGLFVTATAVGLLVAAAASWAEPAQPAFAPLTDQELIAPDQAWRQAMATGLRRYRAGDLVEAERQWMIGLDLARGFGLEGIPLATSLDTLGRLLREQGRVHEARPMLEQALQIREAALGANHPDVALSLNTLAELYDELGRMADAAALLQRAREITLADAGPVSADVATLLSSEGLLAEKMGRLDEAVSFHEKSLAIREKLLKPDHVEVGVGLFYLAQAFDSQGDTGRALGLYERALTIWEKQLGSHPQVARALVRIAGLTAATGEAKALGEAEALYRKAAEIEEKTLGSAHPRLADTLGELAQLHQLRRDYGEAERLYQRALEIVAVSLGEEAPEYAATLGSYAQLLRETGRGEAADRTEAEVREIRARLNP